MTVKRIGILTSGGACAGLNAVIRAVVHRAIEDFGCQVTGINDGTHGLMDRPIRSEDLNLGLFPGGILRLGSTILGTTNTGDPFAFPMEDGSVKERSQEFVDGFHASGLDDLIGVGGDLSLDILNRVSLQGDIPSIGVPKTIDNDVALTEFSVGFSTAVFAAVEALDRLQPTAASHNPLIDSAFGVRAVDLLMSSASGKMVAWQNRQVVDVDLADVTSRSRSIDMSDTLIPTARDLGTFLGDANW